VYSGIVFSAAKGLGLDYCRAPDVGLPRADVVLFLDLDAEVAKRRGGFGGERYEVEEVQRRVRALFKEVGGRGGGGGGGLWMLGAAWTRLGRRFGGL